MSSRTEVSDRELTKAQLENAGWELGEFHRSAPIQCHMVYVTDFRVGEAYLFATPITDLVEQEAPFPPEVLATQVEKLLKKAHRTKLSSKERHALPSVIFGYVKVTRNYEHWRRNNGPTARMHMGINVYGERGVPASVRPFIIYDHRPVVPRNEVARFATETHGQDRLRNPQWFRP